MMDMRPGIFLTTYFLVTLSLLGRPEYEYIARVLIQG